MSSRTTRPLAKLTTRASPSSRAWVSTPGTNRRCTAPTSRTASHTSRAGASMRISLWRVAMPCSLDQIVVDDSILGSGVHAFLENLAVAARELAESPRRHAGGAAEAAHEVRQVGETDIERDVGDRALFIGEQASRVAQAASHDELVGRDAKRRREDAQ